MRLVAVADTHGFERDLGAVPDGDVFIHAGDLLLRGSVDELRVVARWIRSLPHAHKLVIAGNHDWCFQRELGLALSILGDEVVYLQDAGATIDGIHFWGSPWQPEFCGWAFNLPRGGALSERWNQIPAAADVLITHGPPRGIGDRTGVGPVGCDDLLAAVRRTRPALHVFGHIHEDGGFWRDGVTASANVTTAEGSRGATVIDLDLETRAVHPVSTPPVRGLPP